MSNGSQNRVLYVARFEMGQMGQNLQYPETILDTAQKQGTVAGWVQFLVGFPVAVIELQTLVGEISSRPDLQNQLVEEMPGAGDITPAFPKTLFGGYKDDKLMLNYLYLDTDFSDFMADDLKGEPKPQNLHWWLLVNIMRDKNGTPQLWPYPGEFLALAVRLMVDRPWMTQESNPFLYSANFFDTVYLTGGFIKEIIQPTDEQPWPTYKITWRSNPNNSQSTSEYLLFPTDFTEYKVGDRVIILKDVTTNKPTQLWKDPDMATLGGLQTPSGQAVQNVSIAPLMFYSIDPDQPITGG